MSSTTSDNSSEHLCYECATNRPINIMQKYDCFLCGGRKCYNHGGEFEYTCEKCNQSELCSDCYAFGKCGHDYKSSVSSH